MKQGVEFSNTFYDVPGGGEVAREISEQDRQALNEIIERAKALPRKQTESTSDVNIEIERLVVGQKDDRARTLHFFVYQPAEIAETHLPYDPSVMAEYRLTATDVEPDTRDQRIYLSRKHLDTLNSRYDKAEVSARFEQLEKALVDYETALSAGSGLSS